MGGVASFNPRNEQIPQAMSEWIISSGLGVIGFLLMANIILLIAGNFMEPASIILIFAPILFPIAMSLGIDPVHFGIMITVNMEIGMITPPVGLNLYVVQGMRELATVPRDRVLTMRYEDFLADPRAAIARVGDFLGPDCTDGGWVGRVAGHVRASTTSFDGVDPATMRALDDACAPGFAALAGLYPERAG